MEYEEKRKSPFKHYLKLVFASAERPFLTSPALWNLPQARAPPFGIFSQARAPPFGMSPEALARPF